VYNYCLSKGYVLPTVYEGHYNPVGRHAEAELFPLLRKLKISYNAYAALAGGFLTKTPEFFTSDATTGTRWDNNTSLGQLYNSIYNRPCLIEGLKMWDEISSKSGIPKAALSYRWVAFNSVLRPEFGDGLIIGAMSSEQLAQVLGWLKDGALDESVVKRIEEVWETVKGEAAFDNFNT
jgi:aflatoxin B1 aldehyde reductase